MKKRLSKTQLASYRGDTQLVERLARQGNNMDDEGEVSQRVWLVEWVVGRLEIVTTQTSKPPLFYAIDGAHVDTIEFLLRRCKVNPYWKSPQVRRTYCVEEDFHYKNNVESPLLVKSECCRIGSRSHIVWSRLFSSQPGVYFWHVKNGILTRRVRTR